MRERGRFQQAGEFSIFLTACLAGSSPSRRFFERFELERIVTVCG
jgi:hypothetical protein